MSTDLEKIWITSAELQGLVWTLKHNNNEPDAELVSLIKNVLSNLNTMVDGIIPDTPLVSEIQVTDNDVPDDTIDPEIKLEIIYDNDNDNFENEMNVADNTEFEQEEDAEPDSCENNASEAEEVNDASEENVEETIPEEPAEETDVEETEPAIIESPEPHEEIIEEQTVDEEPEINNETATEEESPSPEQKPVETPKVQNQSETISVDEKLSRKISCDIRKAFTLNDKFLYRRELFGNSAQQYNEAMDLISEMQNYDEAEAYFLDNYGWELENHHVKSFMKILFNHFNS